MTDPNKPTPEAILAAHELMKGWLPPSFAKAIDAGELDGFGLWDRAIAIVLKSPPLAEGEGA